VAATRRAARSVVVVLVALLSILTLLSVPAAGATPAPGAAISHPTHYVVTFQQQGLPRGTAWDVTIQGPNHHHRGDYPSRGGSDKLSLRNGTYNFTVSAAGYTASPPNGTFTVSGSNLYENETFGPPTCGASFVEQGLPISTQWSVVLNGTDQSSEATSLSFRVPNGSYSFSVSAVGFVATPENGSLSVDGSNLSVTVEFVQSSYTVTFSEQGLPSETVWSVRLAGETTPSNSSTISFSLPNGTYSFTVGPQAGWVASPENGSLSVNGTPVARSILWSPVPLSQYMVSFSETGLPAGTTWSVTLGGVESLGNTTVLSFLEPNGSLSYEIGTVVGWNPSLLNGSVDVSGAPLDVMIRWTANGTLYPVNFSESGLPSNVLWNVTLNGVPRESMSGSLPFEETNGSYSFVASSAGYTASPASGTILVNGSPVRVLIQWNTTDYSLVFVETGLPAGASWTVTVNGTVRTATAAEFALEVGNGSYAFALQPIPGWTTPTYSGEITVLDGPTTQVFPWTQVVYPVTVRETGLPPKESWSVTLDGISRNGSSGSASFELPNGTYTFSVTLPAGYAANATSGPVRVEGAPALVVLTVLAEGLNGALAHGTLSTSQVLEVVAVAVLVVGAGILWVRDRRNRGPPTP